MTKLLVSVFSVVFIGSLAYEILARSNPIFFEKLRYKTNGKIDRFSCCPRNRLKIIS
jgi:hypothetical protein